MKLELCLPILLLCILVYSCNDDKGIENFNFTSEEIGINVVKIDTISNLTPSNFSLLQSINRDLYLSVSRAYFGYTLFEWDYESKTLEGIFRVGEGPGEANQLVGSAKGYGNSELIFLSGNDAKFLKVNNESIITEYPMSKLYSSVSGFQFAQIRSYVAVSVNPNQTNGKLLLIHNTETDEISYHIDVRIPLGFEPQSRNNFSTLVAYKEGFLFSFLGDRTIHQINFEGEIVKSISFGIDDELPEPFRSETPVMNQGSQPYISKIQVSGSELFFILEGKIHHFNWENETALHKFKIEVSDSMLTNPIVDFATSDGIIYLRYGRNDIYVGNIELGS